jgi:TrmH family RNA methyltransferase
MEKIDSLQNFKIKQVQKLKGNHERKKSGLFVVESVEDLAKVFLAEMEIEYIFLCSNLLDNVPAYLKGYEQKIYYVPEDLFKKISYKENPEGILAVAKRKDLYLDNLQLKKNPLVVVLESVEKPGNLGAILRSADATQVDAVIVCDRRTDIYNPNVIRASLGTVFDVPVVVANKEATLKWLQENKIFSFATALSANQFYTKFDFTKSSALIIGTEHEGLSEFWLQRADNQIKIPMLGQIDSLNASVSTAVILYEIIRQRGQNIV